MRKHYYFIVFLILAGGCASGGSQKAAMDQAASQEADLDVQYAKRYALEDFNERLDASRFYHTSGDFELFYATRDSLVSDLNTYIRTNPHAESDPDFVSLLNHMSVLDTLTVADGFSAEEDSLALAFADWPELNIALDNGNLFSEYNTVFPDLDNNRIDFWIKYFTGPGRERFERTLYRMELYRPTVQRILDEKDLPDELIIIALIESGFSMKAVSYAKAVGPWQFIYGTGKGYGLRMNWWYDERRDIVASTYAACNYLSDLHGIWGDWFLAFAAYNCGEYRVARQVARQRTENFWRLQLPRQTQRYVPKFLASLYILRNPEKYDITLPIVEPIDFDLLTVPDATDLKVIARCAGTSVEVIKELNPQCLRWSTPPNMEVHLKVPAGTGEIAARKLSQLPPEERITYRRHKVRRGETLSQISRNYGTSISAIKQLNGIRGTMIREGKYLLVPMKGAEYATASNKTSKPRYKDSNRSINKQALENYARKSAPPAGYKRMTYTVKDNDTLGEIAEVYRTSARRIRSWNNLSYRRYIYPGQKLAIYVPESYAAQSQSVSSVTLPDEDCCVRKTHVVRRGESFYSISRSYDVSLSEILAWNNRSARSIIRPGDKLDIWKKKGL